MRGFLFPEPGGPAGSDEGFRGLETCRNRYSERDHELSCFVHPKELPERGGIAPPCAGGPGTSCLRLNKPADAFLFAHPGPARSTAPKFHGSIRHRGTARQNEFFVFAGVRPFRPRYRDLQRLLRDATVPALRARENDGPSGQGRRRMACLGRSLGVRGSPYSEHVPQVPFDVMVLTRRSRSNKIVSPLRVNRIFLCSAPAYLRMPTAAAGRTCAVGPQRADVLSDIRNSAKPPTDCGVANRAFCPVLAGSL